MIDCEIRMYSFDDSIRSNDRAEFCYFLLIFIDIFVIRIRAWQSIINEHFKTNDSLYFGYAYFRFGTTCKYIFGITFEDILNILWLSLNYCKIRIIRFQIILKVKLWNIFTLLLLFLQQASFFLRFALSMLIEI